MTRQLLSGFLLGSVLALPAFAQAGPPPSPPCAGPGCGPALCVPTPPPPVFPPRTYLMEEQEAVALPQLKVREVEVGRERGFVVAYREEKRKVCVQVVKPREVQQEVPTTKVEPITTVDPCTGRTCTVFNQVPCVRTMTVTVYDTMPEVHEVIVKVPYLKPGQETVTTRLTVDVTSIPAVRTRLQAVTIPSEITEVPVPPPPCPGPVCPAH